MNVEFEVTCRGFVEEAIKTESVEKEWDGYSYELDGTDIDPEFSITIPEFQIRHKNAVSALAEIEKLRAQLNSAEVRIERVQREHERALEARMREYDI